MESYVGSAAPKKSSTNHVVHGVPISVTGSSSMLPGPCGEGRCGMTAAPGFVLPINTSADCMLTCCGGCPPADSYCCPEAHCKFVAVCNSRVSPNSFPLVQTK